MDPIVTITKDDIQRVVAALLNDSAIPIHLNLNWPFILLSIAMDLCPERSSRKIKESLQLGNISKVEALTKILEEWVEKSGESAKLDKLILVLSSNGLGSMAANAKCAFEQNSKMAVTVTTRKITKMTTTRSLEMMTACDKALSNSVILEEIFKRLRSTDRRTFRLVNKHWLKETFPFWRRTASLRVLIPSVCVSLDDGDDNSYSSDHRRSLITVQEFLELSSKASSAEERQIGINGHNLKAHPFRRLSIIDDYVFVPKTGLKKNIQDAEAFWKLCGTEVTHLSLQNVKIDDNLKVLERILLDSCPKLEELEIDEPTLEKLEFNFGDSWKKSKRGCGRGSPAKTVAENLRKLSLDGKIHEEDSSRILKFCPNIKTFYGVGENYFKGFLLPAANGEFLKPDNVSISCSEDEDLRLFLNYVEKFPSTIQHLDLIDNIILSIARTSPFNLYTALSKLGSSLKTLRLPIMNCDTLDDDLLEGDDIWFMDLSMLSFPNLVKLVLLFTSDGVEKNILRFDFGSLKAMPMLEELEIEIDHFYGDRQYPRFASVEDYYVYRGRRDLYLPRGVPNIATEAYFQPSSNNLKKLIFNNVWPLHSRDVQLLSTWFPNLTHLKATVADDAFTVMQGCWEKLEKLCLYSDSSLSLMQLQKIVETHEKLEIVQAGKYQFPLPTIRVKKGRSKEDVVIEELSSRSFWQC